ncbi:MAG TPA: GH32 C-terminal domain-containing protein [Arachnia sp.]|nr:GH32 C-terminal domain-containing protein [Arachnia sp.]HMT84901.1 GH32 C-terminal domain-containing protein [Arachnia sp.]
MFRRFPLAEASRKRGRLPAVVALVMALILVATPAVADSHGLDDSQSGAIGEGAAPASGSVVKVSATVTNRTVTLAATASVQMEYAVGSGEWIRYDGAFTAGGTGAVVIQYRAIDLDGVAGTAGSVVIPATEPGEGAMIESLGTEKRAIVGEVVSGLGARVIAADGGGVLGSEVLFTVSGGTFQDETLEATVRTNASGIAVAPGVSSGSPGIVVISARFAENSVALPTVTVVEPAAALGAEVVAESKIVAGKVTVAVLAVNTSVETVSLKMTTRYGSKTFASVAPGAAVTYEFKTYLAEIPAGLVTIAVTGATGVSRVTQVVSRAGGRAMNYDTYRNEYHFTIPDHWGNDPIRPVWRDGEYHFYHLYDADFPLENGTGWRHATSVDGVVFEDQGVAIPKNTNINGSVWAGSAIVDAEDSAGFGRGSLVSLVTQSPLLPDGKQAVYLWYSTDGGRSFASYGTDPVISNPGLADWRDPKVIWHEETSRWILVISRGDAMDFYSSEDLISWQYESQTPLSGDYGWIECPDIFAIRAQDGTLKWVLAGSAGVEPKTSVYWTGVFDGRTFQKDHSTPRWLDYGSDYYAAVTWPDPHDETLSTRFGWGWMNNWDYARATPPSWAGDGFNGQYSIVRRITMGKLSDGTYALFSEPTPALAETATRTIAMGDIAVEGSRLLTYAGHAYQIEADVSWTTASNVGMRLKRSADRSRGVDLGVTDRYSYLNRSPSGTLHSGETQSPRDASDKDVRLRILVDRGTVEMFIDDGLYVHSAQVFSHPSDTGLEFYADNGVALFSDVVITEFANTRSPSAPHSVLQSFDEGSYGGWAVTGDAFGSGPASGPLPGQQEVSGWVGQGYATSRHGGDTTTGTLTSPPFTVSASYLNFLIGGGRNPLAPAVFADFEGATFGTGWIQTGSFASEGPLPSSLPQQVGAKTLDTFVGGGDPATGTISSPSFRITRDYVNYLIAGGNRPHGTPENASINLVVDGEVVRTATGSGDDTMRPIAWDVHDLVGRSARIEVVDNAAGGAWAHIMVDHIMFSGSAAFDTSPRAETAVNLVVEGQVVRTATGADDERLRWVSWDVDDLIGSTARIQIVDNDADEWGHVTADQFLLSNLPAA